MADGETPRGPIVPCSGAMAAMGVPARRWSTRTDLAKSLQRGAVHLDSAPLDEASVQGAAAAADLSLHHFLRLFRETYGSTPHRYLTVRRIEAAKRLLLETALTVRAIGLEVGLQNPSAFGRLFRRQVGVSPLDYRKSND